MRPEKIEFLDHFSLRIEHTKLFRKNIGNLSSKNIGSLLSKKKQEEYNCLKLYFYLVRTGMTGRR